MTKLRRVRPTPGRCTEVVFWPSPARLLQLACILLGDLHTWWPS
jgi:hypothetical protein